MKFSIITPSYNQGQFIKKTIDSVINQNGDFDIEYFVMDGGSSDNTIEILKSTEKLLKNSPRISFYWQSGKDKGQTDAINQALKKCSGDIVAYINSDDYYLPGAFQKVVDYFSKNPAKFWVVGNCQVSDPKFNWTFFLKHIWPIHLFKSALLIFNTINQPSVFLKKTLVDKVGKFDTDYHYAFDYDYWLRCQKHSLPGRIFDYLSVFRIQPQSKGNTGFKKQFGEDLDILSKFNPNLIELTFHNIGKFLVEYNYKRMK